MGCAVCGGPLGAGDRHCSRRCAALWRHHGGDPVSLAALRERLKAEEAGDLSAMGPGGGEMDVRRAEVALQALRRRRAREKAKEAEAAKARCWRAKTLSEL